VEYELWDTLRFSSKFESPYINNVAKCMVCIDVGYKKLITFNTVNNKDKSVEYLTILL